MLSFCGMDRCLLDASGRVKLSPRVLEDFAHSGNEVVLHCLPEGAVAVYPENVYQKMRTAAADAAERAGQSMLFRRELRRFGAWSVSQRITQQGRITIPPEYRDFAGLKTGGNTVVVGVEIGIEIWDLERWKTEQMNCMEHARAKGETEMSADLDPANYKDQNGDRK